MKFYYPKDSNGNIIGFKTPESQVYDNDGISLSDKLGSFISNLSVEGNNITYTKGDGTDVSVKTITEATSTNLGGVTVGSNITNNNGEISITKENVISALDVTGVAELDSTGKILSSQLPSYVDDVVEGYLNNSKFYKESSYTTEITGETGKIYIDLSTSKTYRWSGSAFVVISETLALGETSSTAYRGDRGAVAYTHSQSAHAPSNAQANVIETIKVNGTALTPSSKAVNITTTTYTLTKSGNIIKLSGSDGSSYEVSAGGTGGVAIGTSAPSDTGLAWIDTGNGGVLKYYNGSAWTTTKSVWG